VLVAVILPTQEAEIRRIQVQSQPRQIVLETLLKKIHYKKRAGSRCTEFKPQYYKNKIKKENLGSSVVAHTSNPSTGDVKAGR
jgi:hypothetical protein